MKCSVCGKERDGAKAVLFGERKNICPDCRTNVKHLDVAGKEQEAALYLREVLVQSQDEIMRDYLTSVLNGEQPKYPAYYKPADADNVAVSKINNRVNYGASLISFPNKNNVAAINPPDMGAYETNASKAVYADLAFACMIIFSVISIALGILFAVLSKNFLFLAFSLLVGGGIAAGLYFISKYLRVQHKILHSAECQRNNSRKVIELLNDADKK